MKCPFCEASFGDYRGQSAKDTTAHHVQHHHMTNTWVCFCGAGFGGLSRAAYNDSQDCFQLHLDGNGGLEAHAQDFLMGTKQ